MLDWPILPVESEAGLTLYNRSSLHQKVGEVETYFRNSQKATQKSKVKREIQTDREKETERLSRVYRDLNIKKRKQVRGGSK